MVITAKIDGFAIGSKHLFEDLGLSIDDKEKIAIIGRNGVGGIRRDGDAG